MVCACVVVGVYFGREYFIGITGYSASVLAIEEIRYTLSSTT